MSADLVEMRLVRSRDFRELDRWETHVDVRDGKAMRAALVGAVKARVGEDDWEDNLPLHELGWRWNSSCGWRIFKTGK